jgi:hypothetical protein
MQENKASPAQVWDGTLPAPNTTTNFGGGTGSSARPWKIRTAAHLAQLSVNVRSGYSYGGTTLSPDVKFFELTRDIYLNESSVDVSDVDPTTPTPWNNANPSAPYPWYPIGGAGAGDFSGNPAPDPKTVESYAFGGIFDGHGHTIHNAFYNQSVSADKGCRPENEVGIFGSLYHSGGVRNLKAVDGYIGGNVSVGGIVGRTWGGDIVNCHNENFVYGVGSQGAGGIAGTSWVYIPEVQPDGTRLPSEQTVIDECSNSGTVVSNYVKTTDKHGNPLPKDQWLPSGSAGGIVGENEGGVINSWNTGVVSCCLNVGGIVGSNQNSSGGEPTIYVDPAYINNCYNTGDIGHSTATGVNSSIPSVDATVAGGIMGYQTGTCENVYNIGNITDNGEDTEDPARNAAGQIIGQLKIDTSAGAAQQTNDYLNKPVGASPYVGDIKTGTLGGHLYTFDSTTEDKRILLANLNDWVNGNSNYSTWMRSASINDGYPYFVLL